MTARPHRHLHLIHSADDEPELEAGWNWGLIVALGACLLVWALILAGVVLLVV